MVRAAAGLLLRSLQLWKPCHRLFTPAETETSFRGSWVSCQILSPYPWLPGTKELLHQSISFISLWVYRGNPQTSTWVRLPFCFYSTSVSLVTVQGKDFFAISFKNQILAIPLLECRGWRVSWANLGGQGSPMARHCSKCYSASFGVTGLNTNVLAKLTRKKKYGNICHQKTLFPLTFLSVKQWLTEGF